MFSKFLDFVGDQSLLTGRGVELGERGLREKEVMM